VPLTCGARSTLTGSQTGSGGLRVGPVWVGPDTWQAVALPRHGRGPLLGFVHSSREWAWLTVDQVVLVHGPKAGSLVDQVHRHFPWLGSCAPGARLRCSTRPPPLFLPLRAPAGDVLTGELSAAVLAPNWRGEKHRQASATAMVGSGRQLGLPRTLATVVGGSAVPTDGEVACAGFLVSRLGG